MMVREHSLPSDMILAFYTSPHLIDVIMLFTVLEGVVLACWRKLPTRTVIVMLAPGLCLLLAVRAAMAGVAWPWVPVALTGALVTHFFDMRERFRH
jgi:hypothetical protein